MIVLDLSILNQKGTPMFYSDIFANRPNFGIVGRIFISTDTAAIYRDTGTAWDLISDATGAGTNIYNSDGTLTGNRTVSSGNFSLTFNPATTFDTTLTAANNASSLSIFGVNRLSYAAGFSANNIGALYGGSASFGLQTFAGSATFANSNIASGGASINSIDFSSAGSTITMTQSIGLRAMTGNQVQVQYQGTNSGTITHAAIQQNLGFYRPSGASGTLTITNAYSHLINALDDYGAGFTFTNRWGIYQAGSSDTNYFAANMLLGSVVDNGNRFQVTGSGFFSNAIGISTSSPSAKLHSFGGNSSNTLPNNVQGIFENDSNGGIAISTPVGNAAGVYFPYSTDAYYAGLERNSTSLSFRSGGSIKMTLNTTGDLGIGITTPLSTLHLQKSGQDNILSIIGENGYEGALFLSGQGSGKDTNIVYGNGRDLQFFSSSSLTPVVDGTLRMSLTGTGNLVLGSTSDPGQKLYLNGSLRIDGQQSATSSGNSGQHLIINLDGTTYKIKLELP